MQTNDMNELPGLLQMIKQLSQPQEGDSQAPAGSEIEQLLAGLTQGGPQQQDPAGLLQQLQQLLSQQNPPPQ